MKSVGDVQIAGTLGYDIAYAVSVPSPAAPFASVTNRKIALGEAYGNTQLEPYNLAAGKINIVK